MSRSNPRYRPEVGQSFPVLEEKSLSYIPRKFMRIARRNLAELPTVRPGSVLVFHHGSQYHVFEETKPLTGSEETVVDATSVFLVDMRRRLFTVQFKIPSARPANDFVVRAIFSAQVTNAEQAAAGGPIALVPYLTTHVEKDRPLLKLGSQYRVEDIAVVRNLVVSRVEAYWEFSPIILPGLSVWLDSASVLTNAGLRIHDSELLAEERKQRLDQLHAEGEDIGAGRYRRYVDDGSAALTALGLSRGETPVNDAINAAHQIEERQQEKIAEAIRLFQQNGNLDYVDIDPTEMVDAYVEKLTGKQLTGSARHAIDPHAKRHRHALASGNEDPDDEPLDEADLDDE